MGHTESPESKFEDLLQVVIVVSSFICKININRKIKILRKREIIFLQYDVFDDVFSI